MPFHTPCCFTQNGANYSVHVAHTHLCTTHNHIEQLQAKWDYKGKLAITISFFSLRLLLYFFLNSSRTQQQCGVNLLQPVSIKQIGTTRGQLLLLTLEVNYSPQHGPDLPLHVVHSMWSILLNQRYLQSDAALATKRGEQTRLVSPVCPSIRQAATTVR